jgi:hypothetical protein
MQVVNMKSFLVLLVLAAMMAVSIAKHGLVDLPAKCKLPKDPGPCKAKIPRYYYDASRGRCRLFNYGGCKGNANNFKTLRECKAACELDICTLASDPGPCEAIVPRWAYNGHFCEEFTYGGCLGNANNFETREACEAACPAH